MRRRDFLKGSAVLSVSFLAACAVPPIPDRPKATAGDATGWIQFTDGRYRLLLPRAEMGQGIGTALKQIACQELQAVWDEVDVVLASTSEIPGYRATVGSESIRDYAVPLAKACAALRQARAGGQTVGTIDPDDVDAVDLLVFRSGPYVGRPMPTTGHQEIVRGTPLFADDVQLEKLAYGRVLRAPLSPELASNPASWNTKAAEAVPGFVGLFSDGRLRMNNADGLGIVAETPGALDRIEQVLAVKWSSDSAPGQPDVDRNLDIDRRLARSGLSHTVEERGRIETGEWDIDMRFDMPFGPHHAIEPRTAVADVRSGSARMWVGSQDPFYARKAAADRIGLSEEDVDVTPMRVGGAFGGKTIVTVEIEAAVLSLLAGRPVKVRWTRQQELRQAFHRPQTSHRVRAKLKDGRIDSWRHGFCSGHVIFTNAALPEWMQSFTDFIGDSGAARGSLPDYDVPNMLVDYDLKRLPVLTGPWRGLGAAPNAVAIECTMDACARHAGADPVDFRLRHIRSPGLARALQEAIRLAGTPGEGRGRGVACGVYKQDSYAAVVVDVTEGQDGRPEIVHMWCAHDCGRIINPDQVRAQCEGNMVWGLSMAYFDRLTLRNGKIDETDFLSAPIPAMADTPPMTVSLIDAGDAPAGAGETVMVAATAAIANAVADLTGRFTDRLPIDLVAPAVRG